MTTAQAIDHYQSFLGGATASIVAGEFNASVIWDRQDRPHNFSNVNSALNDLGLTSAYHKLHKQDHGLEIHPTLYFRRNISNSYHIDYVYVSSMWLTGTPWLTVGSPDEWLRHSDHMPLLVECGARRPTATTA